MTANIMDAASPRSRAAARELIARFESHRATIGIIGMGYVGLPLARAFVSKGFRVLGFDIDPAKVAQLNSGQSYIRHIGGDTVAAMIRQGFRATADMADCRSCDAVLVCVPTPLTRQREPDMTYIVSTSESIRPHLRAGQLVVLESTTYPGTTTEIMRPLLEKSGLSSGEDFFLAFSPEREDPGNLNFETTTIPKVVGGDGLLARDVACALYNQIVPSTVAVSSAATAEAVKLTENIFRSVNIALVNEMKVIYSRMGIDIWEVIDAAKSKPFGFMPFYPGPGLGGHCIPIDPFYLTWKAREFDVATRFIELAGEINVGMPAYVIDHLAAALDERFAKALNGARILVLGVSYKKNIDDTRESPSLKIIEMLEARRAKVDFYDPCVPVIGPTREHAELAGRRSITWSRQALQGYDAALIVTDHDDVDYAELVACSRLVVDTRNATRAVTQGREVILKA